jgi:creatinine amidohydrolase
MHIKEMHWQQVEAYLQTDDRCILPLGSTEQHAFLSLCVDNILAERVSTQAADPLGIPVFPVLCYGVTPYFRAFPGSISLRLSTYLSLFEDILNSLYAHGFRRILVVNGHGGNSPAMTFANEWLADHTEARLRFHNWWNAPRTWEQVRAIDPVASHASWMENFPWTRLADVEQPTTQKPTIDTSQLMSMPPQAVRTYLGDGNFGGFYQRSDEAMLTIWRVAVQETRDLLTSDW